MSARKLKRLTKALRIGKLLGGMVSKQKMRSMENKVVASKPAVDWDKTSAFSMGRSGEGYIYLLGDGPQREKTAQAVVDGLLSVRNPATGQSVIKHVWPKESLYSGEAMDMLPDLILEPSEGYSCTGACRPEEELFVSVADKNDFHQGKHHRDGIYLFHGPGVRPMQGSANLIDLPCTILSVLGVDTHSMEGTVLKDCFTYTEEQWNQKKSTQVHFKEKDVRPEQIYSSEDEAQIKKRLEDLGYL